MNITFNNKDIDTQALEEVIAKELSRQTDDDYSVSLIDLNNGDWSDDYTFNAFARD